MTAVTISKESVIKEYYWFWPLFCLQAGLINSGGFIACHRFVSHVTGFGTRIGMEFLQKNFLLGLEMLFIPVGFIAGCFLAGYMQEVKKDSATGFLLISCLLMIVWGLGATGAFGTFGEPLLLQRDFLLLFLLCFACGIQNGLIASMTAGIVRTTHMTGIATDIGLSLTRVLFGSRDVEMPWFKLRVKKIIFFALGAAAGTLLFTRLEFTGFLVPALLNLILMTLLIRSKIRDDGKGTYIFRPRALRDLQSDRGRPSSRL